MDNPVMDKFAQTHFGEKETVCGTTSIINGITN